MVVACSHVAHCFVAIFWALVWPGWSKECKLNLQAEPHWPPSPHCSQLPINVGLREGGEKAGGSGGARESDTEQGNDHSEMGTRLPEHRDVKSWGPARPLPAAWGMAAPGTRTRASSTSSHVAGDQWRREEGWGLNPRVSQLWRAPNEPSLFTGKELGLLDRLGGVELLSELQKGFLRRCCMGNFLLGWRNV